MLIKHEIERTMSKEEFERLDFSVLRQHHLTIQALVVFFVYSFGLFKK